MTRAIPGPMVIDTVAHYRNEPPAVLHEFGGHETHPASLEELIALMDEARVDKLIQVTSFVSGFDNSHSLQGAARHPQRIRVLGRFDPRPPDVVRRLRAFMALPGMIGVRFVFAPPPEAAWLRDGTLCEFWRAAEALDVPVAAYAPGQAATLGAIAARHPGIRLTVDHVALSVTRPQKEPAAGPWAELLALERLPNVSLKVSGLPQALEGSYPFPAAQRLLRQVYECFGADRLMWGSNYPAVSKVCAYRQTIDFIRQECDFLSDSDRAKILGGSAQRILNLKWN